MTPKVHGVFFAYAMYQKSKQSARTFSVAFCIIGRIDLEF